nr:oligosaccharide flippase family protein [Methylobacterium sp. OTU13CASTA1]
MTATLSHNPTLAGPAVPPGRPIPGQNPIPGQGPGSGRRVLSRFATHRGAVLGYFQLLAGSGGRLVLQVLYFFLLANTLSLADMGVFATVSAAGVLIGCLAGFGFQSAVMRAAARRRSSLGGYLAAYYACSALALPIMLALAGLLYLVLFREVIALPGYLAIIVVEIALWREIELLVQVNSCLGRFGAASTLVSLPVGFRAAAAVAFWAMGGGDAERWSLYYLVGNLVAVVVLVVVFHPRVRMRLRPKLVRGKLRDGLYYTLSHFLFLSQGEIDKIIILSLAGERMAGIYAITIRLIDLTAVPLRPMYMMYSRKLIQAGRVTKALLRESMRIEVVIAGISTGGLLALIALLSIWPNILGTNVSAAYGMLTVVLVVPAVRNLLEFHSELLFGFGNLGLRAAITGTLVLIKALSVAALITLFPAPESWTLGLNAASALIYGLSFLAVYGLLTRNAA